jgi:uncharacterized protein YyaL (SSP411 family)
LFLEEVYARFLPNKVLALMEPGNTAIALTIKLLAEKTAVDGTATAYVCRNYTCLAPATTTLELAERLTE